MKVRELAKFIAKKEGKKSQVAIGDIREIISILSDLFCIESVNVDSFGDLTAVEILKNGQRRYREKGKK